jgi:hypothetical protein
MTGGPGILGVIVAAAWAAPVPAGSLHVRISRADVVEQFAAWASSHGATGDAAVPVCRPFAEGVHLCAVVEEAGTRRMATRADGVALPAAEAAVRARASATLATLERRSVDGAAGTLWVRARGDGQDHDPLVDPEALARRVGTPLVVAAPTRDLLVAWNAGDPAFDRIVAVGILKACETDAACASALAWRWDGATWRTWGKATREGALSSPPPAPAPR